MSAFPTLSRNPEYSLEQSREDTAIKSPKESGKVFTRARFSTDRKRWVIRYELLTSSDATLLDNFEATVRVCADAFTWTHPATSVVYTVRFESPPKLVLSGFFDNEYKYSYEATLVQV